MDKFFLIILFSFENLPKASVWKLSENYFKTFIFFAFLLSEYKVLYKGAIPFSQSAGIEKRLMYQFTLANIMRLTPVYYPQF